MPAIRPKRFKDFAGQRQAVAKLEVAVKAALVRKQPLAHVLLDGGAGLGKTSLGSSVLPTELGVSCTYLNCAGIEKPGDFVSAVLSVQDGQMLFLDEVHALTHAAREHLLSILEDFKVVVTLGEGPDSKPMTLTMPHITVVAATTRQGMLSEPLRDRFRHQVSLVPYTDDEMYQVLDWTATSRDASFTEQALKALIPPAHGTARKAVAFVEACLDTQAVDGNLGHTVSSEQALRTLARLGYAGPFDANEVRYLVTLRSVGRTVGLTALAGLLQEDPRTVEDVLEPWLLRQGYVLRQPSGREITPAGLDKLRELNL